MAARPVNVRFLRQWHGFAPGATTPQLGLGVATLLVQRNICAWDGESPQPSPSAQKQSKSKRSRRAD